MTTDRQDPTALHPVRAVVERTGLTPDLLRAWERRYRTVEPQRSAGRQRLYSEADIARLSLLKTAVDGGWPISHVAPFTTEALKALAAALKRANEPDRRPHSRARAPDRACAPAVAGGDAV